MKKPEHQWETRLHLAYRRTAADGAPGDAAVQRFELRFRDGRVGHAVVDLDRQEVDSIAASDPDLPQAIRCWLAARGKRSIALHRSDGTALEVGSFVLPESSPEGTSPAARIVTLAPSCAELVESLGCFDRVIACEDSSDWPDAVSGCIRLGPDLAPDLDQIADLAPDLVISSLTVPGMERVVSGLHARRIPQLVCAPRSLHDVVVDVDRVARRLHVPDAGREVCTRMLAERDDLKNRRARPPVRVYLEWWPRPMFTPGRDCYSNELIDLAGGINVFGTRPGASVRIDAADLMSADPQVCFVSWCGVAEDKLDPDNLVRRAGLEGLAAARSGRVFALDERFSGRPGPRMLEASRRMAAVIEELGPW